MTVVWLVMWILYAGESVHMERVPALDMEQCEKAGKEFLKRADTHRVGQGRSVPGYICVHGYIGIGAGK